MTQPQHLVIMGVASSGKTTIAQLLVERLGWVYAEADQFHPQANIDKMSAGTPLEDDDRWPWLRAIRTWLDEQDQAGRNTVITCSALKRVYRDILQGDDDDVFFVHLSGSPELIADRMSKRAGHFMPTSLLPSQFSTLEPLGEDEPGISVDISGTPAEITDEIVERLGLNA
ncbi:gluconokinase [Georgenia subflava]|uniref:Gluconokinase n=1 Tax=Georgenia subflava TaxID=1622177 RepID=A0A6N7EFW3_9MICO|nr:gluconokinase [Georgenia subflava]MPV36073.1 gluconokinase [Georgenia subflava]